MTTAKSNVLPFKRKKFVQPIEQEYDDATPNELMREAGVHYQDVEHLHED